jgi:hypothetical protein
LLKRIFIMGLFRMLKKKAASTVRTIGRTAVRRASGAAKKHGRKLLKRAVIVGVASAGTAFGGPIGGATLAKLTGRAL